MPLLQISLRAGKPEAYRQAILDGLYRAMREALDVPDDDQFMCITEHDAANIRTGNAYGVSRSSDVVYIQISVFSTRTAEQKKALFRRIAELFSENPGIRPEDVFVIVHDAPKENWSVGNGIAQFLRFEIRVERETRLVLEYVRIRGSRPRARQSLPMILTDAGPISASSPIIVLTLLESFAYRPKQRFPGLRS